MAEVSSAWAFMLMKFGMAISIRMIMMDMTISSSIRVKPRWRLRSWLSRSDLHHGVFSVLSATGRYKSIKSGTRGEYR